MSLDCPSTCVYLRQARAHEKPRTVDDVDAASVFPEVEVPEQFLREKQELFTGFWFAIRTRARADRNLNDREVIAAIRSLAKSYETRVNSGLHYEPPTASVPQQAVADELQKMVEEYQQTEQKHLGYSRLRDSEVFKGLVFLLRFAEVNTSGRPKSRRFLDWLAEQFPEEKLVASPAESSRIIVP